jgi:uncharacterized protein
MTAGHQPEARPLALVTGASSGIGRALAHEFAERAFDVVVAAEEPAIHEAAAELAASGATVTAVEVNLATARGVEELYRRATEGRRAVSALALNAGVGVNGRFGESRVGDELNLVDLNVRSTVHLAHLAVRDMVAAGEGRILVTSSIAAVSPGPYHATYAASKAFVHSFAEGIRVELKDTGVTVTSLMPGPTDTEFFERADMGDTRIGQLEDKDDPRDVARDGVQALLAGKASVVAGSIRNRIGAELGTHLPDALMAPLASRMTKPGE